MAWSSSNKRGTREQQPRLRALAYEKGYEAKEALRSDGWHLIDSKGQKVSDKGRTTFTILEAMEWLKRA